MSDLEKHGHQHLLGGPDPIPASAIYEIKVFDDLETIVTGDGKFEWEIPEDLDGAVLVRVEAFVSTVSSSGGLLVQIANEREAGGTVDMLATRVGIDSGELNSKTAATAAVIDTANDTVAWGDHLRIDVDSAGTGAKGLGVILIFSPSMLATIILRGVANWLGDWTTSTDYTKGDAVTNDGSSYVAIADHTSGATSEPGTGANWQTYWMLLSAGSGAGGYTNYETRSSNTQLETTDAGKLIDITATITQTFNTDDNLGDGWWVVLRNATDDGTTIVTLDPDGSETIDGIATPKMYSGETRLIFCNGAGGNFNSILLEGGFARFTSTGAGTFQVPHGITEVFVDCIGGGGGGGGQSNHGPSDWPGGSGGGGGARAQRAIPSDHLANPGSTVSLSVGTGGNGGSNADGTAGGNSSFGSSPVLVLACGGGGGGGGTSGASYGGGGGGAGVAGGTDDGVGGMNSANANGIGGQGGGSSNTFGAAGKPAEWGGGGGGAAHNNGTGGAGGSSLHGGGGGGGGGASELDAGGEGGGTGAWTSGGGGAAGTSGGNGTAGASGDVGAGGGGGSGNSSGSSGGQGGAGGVPGGGGGGSAVLNSNTPAGGNGGRGEVRVRYS